MSNFQAYRVVSWLTLLCLVGSAVSQRADCNEGLMFDAQQGEPFTFSIPLNKSCSAALATFSDGTDLMLDPGVSSTCYRSSPDTQAFTAVIGSDASEGTATFNFQCGGETYCMSLNIAPGNASGMDTTLRSACLNSTQAAGGSRKSAGEQSSQTKEITTGNSVKETKSMTSASLSEASVGGNTSPLATYSGSSNGFGSTDNVGADTTTMQNPSKNEMSNGIPADQTSSRPNDDSASINSPSVTASPSDSSMLGHNPTTWSIDASEALVTSSTTQQVAMPLSTLSTARSSEGDDPSASSHPTLSPAAQSSLSFSTSLTVASGQDPSTCACFPRSSN